MGIDVGESFTSHTHAQTLHFELKHDDRIVLWAHNETTKVLDLPLDEAEKMYRSLEIHLKLAGREL